MKSVFMLWHVHEFKDGEDDAKLIGVYITERSAKLAQARAKNLPGFSQHPNGFIIDEYKIGKDHWMEGFITAYPGRKLKNRRTKHSNDRQVRGSVSSRRSFAR